jgi:hypothetical protein
MLMYAPPAWGEPGKRGEGKKTVQRRTGLPFATSLMAAMMAAAPGDTFADANQTIGNTSNPPGLIG